MLGLWESIIVGILESIYGTWESTSGLCKFVDSQILGLLESILIF